jgi:quercetin 2,3-dioxygenase
MMALRRANERGHADHGWLDTYHTFSFAHYYDPEHMGFASLRVINEDKVKPGQGFGTHGHRDMEIITYILEGALEHKDSMGNGSVIRPGDVQRMSAGRGVMHSEFNPSPSESVHLLQIWIEPNVTGIEPSYEQTHFDEASRRGRLRLIASNDGRNGSTTVHQDAAVYAALIDGNEALTHRLTPGRSAYVHVARGAVTVNGARLNAGDGLKATNESKIVLEEGKRAEVLLFDLA